MFSQTLHCLVHFTHVHTRDNSLGHRKTLKVVKAAKFKWGPTSIMTHEIHPLGSNPFPKKRSGCPTSRFSVIVRNDTGAFRVIHTQSRTSKTPFQGKVMPNFHHETYPKLGHMERFSPDLIHFYALPWILCCLVIHHAFSIFFFLMHYMHSYKT